MQIFLKRELVDKYVYAAMPCLRCFFPASIRQSSFVDGYVDDTRMPLGAYLSGDGPLEGQVRILVHPSIFMRAATCRLFVYSADPTFHEKRDAFQVSYNSFLVAIWLAPR